MWYRKLLKEEAKKVFTYKDNYWKFVLAGLIILLLTGGISGVFSTAPGAGLTIGGSGNSNSSHKSNSHRTGSYKEYMTGQNGTEYFSITNENGKITYSHGKKPSDDSNTQQPGQGNGSQVGPNNGDPNAGTNNSTQDNNSNSTQDNNSNSTDIEKQFGVEEQYSDDYDKYNGDYPDRRYMYDEDFDEDYDSRDSALFAGVGVMVIVLVTILVVIGMALGMTFKAFLVNPLVLGVRKFFLKSYDCPGNFVHFGDGYKYNYIKNVGTLFLKDLFTMLWSLLFIVPGIIKSYEYRMIPYLIAENPDMTYQEAFAKSKDMMMGNKWNAFVLDLSFLGWFALNALTCGILGIFYVNPYYYATDANLYRALKMGGDTGYRSDEYARLVAAQQAAAANTTQQAAPTADATTQTQESEQAAPTTEPMQTASSDTSQAAQETQTTTTQETSAEVDSGNESSAETDSKEE